LKEQTTPLEEGNQKMSEKLSLRKMIPVIVITWILSFATTLAFIYLAPLVPIDTDKINDSAITSNKIADEAIITTKLPDGTVTSAKILDGTIIAQDIADGSIITVKVEDGAITTTKIADNAVTTAKIADTAIISVKLADGAVTSAKILDGTITAEDLATGAVTSIKIAEGAVTNTKLAAGAIPYNSTYTINIISTSSINWQNMSGMSINLHLDRTSHVLIMFSASARLTSMVSPATMYARAMIGSTIANPNTGTSFTSTVSSAYECSTFTFYLPNVNPGTHTICIQWTVSNPMVTAYVNERTLNVIALPA
jgi:hypothetical protein